MDYKLEIDSKTHLGNKRELNEDNLGYYENKSFSVFVVCDGMGGSKKGELASKLAIEEILNHFRSVDIIHDCKDELMSCLDKANKKILYYSENNPETKGMGTTCTVALICKGSLYTANIGDSRIYYNNESELKQITKDQTVVQQLLDKNLITKDEALSHPRKNELTQALGILKVIKPNLLEQPVRLKTNDIILLCTDGLYNEIKYNEIKNHVNSNKELKVITENLVQAALDSGGNDNISVILLKVISNTYNRPVEKKPILNNEFHVNNAPKKSIDSNIELIKKIITISLCFVLLIICYNLF